jgi:hypothetical protein
MKRFILTAIILCACALTLLAQPPGGRPGGQGGPPGGQGGPPGGGGGFGGGQRQPPDYSKLNNGKPLTEAQKKAIKAASDKRTEAMKKVTDDFKASMAKAMGVSVAELEKRAAVANIRLGGRGPGGPGGPGGPPGGGRGPGGGGR